MAILESRVEKMLVDACKAAGIPTVKSENVDKGFPDRMLFVPNHGVIFVEIKNKTNYVRQARQKRWAKRIIAAKGKYYCIDGEQEMRQFIDKIIFWKGA